MVGLRGGLGSGSRCSTKQSWTPGSCPMEQPEMLGHDVQHRLWGQSWWRPCGSQDREGLGAPAWVSCKVWGSQVPRGCGDKGDYSGMVVQIPAKRVRWATKAGGRPRGGSGLCQHLGAPKLPRTEHRNKQTNKKTRKRKKKKTQKRLSGWHSAETPGMQEHLRGQDDQKLVPLFLMFYDLERKGKTFATFLNAENEWLFQNYLLKL